MAQTRVIVHIDSRIQELRKILKGCARRSRPTHLKPWLIVRMVKAGKRKGVNWRLAYRLRWSRTKPEAAGAFLVRRLDLKPAR